jgi:acyl dehydratase
MPGLNFEDFEIGKNYRHEASRSVTDFDNIWYSCMTLNTQPLHLSMDFSAKQGLHGKPLFNSMYTLSIIIGQCSTDLTRGTLRAVVSMNDIQFPRSVFAGDTLYSRTTIVGKRVSDDHPDCGIVDMLHEGLNQSEEIVATCKRTVLVSRRVNDRTV